MRRMNTPNRTIILMLGLAALAACGKSPAPAPGPLPQSEIECLARAMYFESNRSSRNGMIAVGTVVLNRVHSDAYPNTVCGVVGQKNQFAPGVMTKPMNSGGAALARETAVAAYRGERHPKVGRAKFFHAAWYRANYNNMHYLVTAGGNAFYEKRRPELVTNPRPFAEE